MPVMDVSAVGTGKRIWGNLVRLHPMMKHGAGPASYYDVALKPAAEALNAVIKANTGTRLGLG